MPQVMESVDLLAKYGEISDFCHNHREPLLITRNGQEDLAVMSFEIYEELMERVELHKAIKVGLDQIKNGEIITEEEMDEKLIRYMGR
jgi:PHD/YefM family antitoxin component YafN of YafNO toxin-antitoxin module